MSSALRQFFLASTSRQAIHAASITQTWAEPLSTKEVRSKNERRPMARTASYCTRGWQGSDTQAQQAVRVEGSSPSNSTNSGEMSEVAREK